MLPPLPNKAHHWWPRGLSKFWANEAGITHKIAPNGDLILSQPKSFGFINHAHNVRLADVPTVWDLSFEHTFGSADDAFPELIAWLKTLSPQQAPNGAPFEKRLTPVSLQASRHRTLAECLASLIVRSPSLRSRIRLTTEYYRKRLGFEDPIAGESLISINLRSGQENLSKSMSAKGKFAVLLSGNQEFIFGDGFLNNVSSVTDVRWNPSCLVPLTPEIAVFYTSATSGRDFPNAFVLSLWPEEVSFVNWTVQVYACQQLFFRDIYPIIDEAFTRSEHLEFEYHKHDWLSGLENAMTKACFGEDNC